MASIISHKGSWYTVHQPSPLFDLELTNGTLIIMYVLLSSLYLTITGLNSCPAIQMSVLQLSTRQQCGVGMSATAMAGVLDLSWHAQCVIAPAVGE